MPFRYWVVVKGGVQRSMFDNRFQSSQVTMTRSERQKREALRRRRSRIAREPVIGSLLLIILLFCAAVILNALIRSKVTGEVPELAGRQLYIVLSSSMEPTAGPGSLLVVKPTDPVELKKDDIIVFIDPADSLRVISHRITRVNALSFTTRGDANYTDDPQPVPAENILGKSEFVIPYAGYILNFAQTTTGLVTIVLIPSLLIIIFESRNLRYYLAVMKNKRQAGSGLSR